MGICSEQLLCGDISGVATGAGRECGELSSATGIDATTRCYSLVKYIYRYTVDNCGDEYRNTGRITLVVFNVKVVVVSFSSDSKRLNGLFISLLS